MGANCSQDPTFMEPVILFKFCPAQASAQASSKTKSTITFELLDIE